MNPVDKLKDIINDPNFSRMNMSNVKGYLGELIIKYRLEKEGCTVIHKGNQSNYDLEVTHPVVARIDVKFSSVKGTKKYPDYGWALKFKNKKDLKSTHFVCIGLSSDLGEETVCIIKADDIDSFSANDGRFKTVTNAFSIPSTKNSDDFRNTEYHQKCKKLLKEGKAKIVKDDHKLLDYLG
jgi:hypothetical protein